MEVMREVVEYAVGIFHGSIMAIQSKEGMRSVGGICRFDVRVTRFIRRRTPESDATSSRMYSPSILARSRRCFLFVSGQPNGERAAQKLNLSSSPHRRRRSGDENIGSDELPIFPNGYAALLLKSPPPAPPALLRRIGVKELTGIGKAKFAHWAVSALPDLPAAQCQLCPGYIDKWIEQYVDMARAMPTLPNVKI
ncbi:hypothetical protein ALC53_10977 [Atta colombica]|uniref:Uncharacterized protein n=1 Tax=Atta colombica TaxID=520822 RepID=A0A195B206_9HYME|nr:hypothetical protein ALC53_10977 [Atta colombica]